MIHQQSRKGVELGAGRSLRTWSAITESSSFDPVCFPAARHRPGSGRQVIPDSRRGGIQAQRPFVPGEVSQRMFAQLFSNVPIIAIVERHYADDDAYIG